MIAGVFMVELFITSMCPPLQVITKAHTHSPCGHPNQMETCMFL